MGRRAHRLRRIVFGTVASLIFLSCQSDADRQLSTRLKSTFGISLPCSLRWCDSYMDGGSVGGIVVDRRGDSLQWAWSPLVPGLGRRAQEASVPRDRLNAWVDSVLLATPFPVYVGVTYYRNPGGRPLPIEGSAESLFIQLLWHVVGADSELTEEPDHKRPLAASVARALQRQRAGKTALRTRPGAP